jgi:(heptosyl)LPS beta-1,4-glucosyltransferase
MTTVCAAVIARDAAPTIEACLRSLIWADSLLVVVDDRTVDATAEIAASLGARVEKHRFEDYARQRNAALKMADADWVFFVDADEVGTPELEKEIRCITGLYEGAAPGYWVPRRNIIMGRWVRHAGWSPDYQMRLLRRVDASYREDRIVHELVDLKGQPGYLRNPLVHYNYSTLREFCTRQQQYARMEAVNRSRQGVRIKPQNYVLQPWRQFWRRFVTLEGYREGRLGLLLSALLGYYELRTYLELRALQRLTQR